MERKIITEEQKKILKSWKEHFEAYMTDKGAFYNYDTPVFVDFCKLVEADCNTLCRLSELYSGEIAYSKEDGRYIVTCLMKRDSCILENLSVELESEEDFLGLYSKEADNSKEADTSLGSFFNDSLENVVRKLKETYPDVVESIEQNVISNIRDYDLEESAKENIANEWIEDNPRIAVDEAEGYLTEEEKTDIVKEWGDYLSDNDKKRFICDWVDNL